VWVQVPSPAFSFARKYYISEKNVCTFVCTCDIIDVIKYGARRRKGESPRKVCEPHNMSAGDVSQASSCIIPSR